MKQFLKTKSWQGRNLIRWLSSFFALQQKKKQGVSYHETQKIRDLSCWQIEMISIKINKTSFLKFTCSKYHNPYILHQGQSFSQLYCHLFEICKTTSHLWSDGHRQLSKKEEKKGEESDDRRVFKSKILLRLQETIIIVDWWSASLK